MLTTAAFETRQLAPPVAAGDSLITPARSDIGLRLAENRQDPHRASAHLCCGNSLADLASRARRDMLDLAWQYTSAYRDPLPLPHHAADEPLLVSGHQPQLFHPGVWFKNFLLTELGVRHQASRVNLLIDNDICRSASIRVPTNSLSDPRITTVSFDAPTDPVPFEQRLVQDTVLFETFAARVVEQIEPFVDDPLVSTLWRHATSDLAAGQNLGETIARARNCLEAEWGVDNLELPLSHVCRTASFREFLLHMLVQAENLREIYNRWLLEYRRVNRIRSRSHPVPELASVDDWCEVPFWIWSDEESKRRRLFVRRSATGFELTDRDNIRLAASLAEGGEPAAFIEQLNQWENTGIRIRPRALITTMFARLFLSDLFVHGIGGAEYDELTDAIIGEFFGVRPPNFVVATATVKLPLDNSPVGTAERLREVEREMRELRFHPENHLSLTSDTRSLIETKRDWINTQLPRGQRKPRHDAITASNEALQVFVADQHEHCRIQHAALESELRRERILGSREFSFCLFPGDGLRGTLLELSRQEP